MTRFITQWLLAALCLLAGGPAVAQAPAPRPLVYAMWADIKDWDPAIASSAEVILLANVYETLVVYRMENGQGVLRPGLATAWSSSKDGREWRFTLRQGVKFHDGEPFDAAAAKASIERTIKLGKGASYLWEAVESVAAPDAHTLVVRCRKPAPIDLVAAAQYAAYMVSPKAMAQGTDWFNQGHAAGTGPYKVRQWTRGQGVALERFDGYWRGWKPGQFAQVQLKLVQEAATQAQMIRSGAADFVTLPSVDVVRRLVRDPAIRVQLGPSWKNLQVVMNTRKPPTDNLQFRRGLALAWDYQAVVSKVFEGGGQPATGLIPAAMWGHDDTLRMPRLDLAEARRLIEASGVPPAQRRVRIDYIATSEEYKNALLIFKANLEKIGVAVELRPGPWGMLWDDAKRPETAPNLMPLTWWPSYASPSDWLIGLFRTESPTVFNLSHYANPAYDALVNQGLALEAVDRQAATAAYAKAQQLLIDEAVAIFAADFRGRLIYRRRIQGAEINPAYEAVFFYDLSSS